MGSTKLLLLTVPAPAIFLHSVFSFLSLIRSFEVRLRRSLHFLRLYSQRVLGCLWVFLTPKSHCLNILIQQYSKFTLYLSRFLFHRGGPRRRIQID